ncbi:MAG: VTT domain-containing protein [Gammaproteobacteria bacterium]|jgi:uncharacterized membrane protein YdjX (TVP38/TMEM64 family)
MHYLHYVKTLWLPAALLALGIMGVIVATTADIDWQQTINLARGCTQNWWMAPALMILQIVLYTFTLPGSLILWIVAPLYPPVTGTIILVTGSTLGALTAYLFAQWKILGSAKWIQKSKIYNLLNNHGDFLTLCALRTMPNFPHSVINYGSGLLRIPIVPFLVSTVIGLSLKSFLYCKAIYSAVSATNLSEIIRLNTLGPLIVVTLLVVAAEYLRLRWWRSHR